MGEFTKLVRLAIKAWYYKDNPKVRTIWLRLQNLWEEVNELWGDLNEILNDLREEG